MNICSECKHHVSVARIDGDSVYGDYCKNPQLIISDTNNITGEFRVRNCTYHREDGGLCGHEGKLYEDYNGDIIGTLFFLAFVGGIIWYVL